jgi:hypothetical protein
MLTHEIYAKEETFGISSSITLEEDHEARQESRHATNMTPNDPRTEASTCKSSGIQPENSEAWIAMIQVLTVKETMSKDHMQLHTNKESREKQPGGNRGRTGPKQAWADRPSPFRARFGAPFDLDALRTIYSAPAKNHEELHSSSAAKEQRREGHHPREEKVEMVD